jgi:hypothetical protein
MILLSNLIMMFSEINLAAQFFKYQLIASEFEGPIELTKEYEIE